jgi:hypothetical protein
MANEAAFILLNLLAGASQGYFARKQQMSAENQKAIAEEQKRQKEITDKFIRAEEDRIKKDFDLAKAALDVEGMARTRLASRSAISRYTNNLLLKKRCKA